MRKYYLLILFVSLFLTSRSYTQTPTSCLEIESILVDACGTPEWENEMVRFTVGPTALNLSAITVSWPNNIFRGLCQNATTANAVSNLNATIQGCGYLKEPVGGVLPAGAKVLFFTDVNVSTTANSFTNLNDTLIAIFQCSGNSAGHFVNYNSSPGIRTLTIGFSSPAGCSDQVTYDRSLMVNQNGTTGGSSALLDGGRVDFSWNGTPDYVNSGCQAPFTPLTVSAGSNLSECSGDPVTINGSVTGNYSSLFWSGGTGTFSTLTNDTTVYTPGIGESGVVTLTLNVISACNDTASSAMTVTINTIPSASISLSGNDTICAGSSVTLTGSGGSTYLWNTTSTLPSIQVTVSGTYTLTASNNCGSSTAEQAITVLPLPATAIQPSGPVTICTGNTATLTASGAETYLWTDGTTGTSITVSQAGTYTVTGYTSYCGSLQASVTVSVGTSPDVLISSGSPAFCEGSTLTLNATGADTYLWSDGSTSASITVTQGGSYSVTGTNSCGTDSASLAVNTIAEPVATVTGTKAICNGMSTALTASGGDTFTWSTGETSATVNYSSALTAYVIVNNACGDDTAHFTITTSTVFSSFTANTITGVEPLEVIFTNTSQNSALNSWNFGDGGSSSEYSPTHTYEAGTFLVILTSTSPEGCVDTSSVTIMVQDAVSSLSVPNVFTPNGDSKNDIFSFTYKAIAEFHAEIYDRWGLKIATVTDIDQGWDGYTDSGKAASTGTYFYIITAKGHDDIEYKKQDSFMLFR